MTIEPFVYEQIKKFGIGQFACNPLRFNGLFVPDNVTEYINYFNLSGFSFYGKPALYENNDVNFHVINSIGLIAEVSLRDLKELPTNIFVALYGTPFLFDGYIFPMTNSSEAIKSINDGLKLYYNSSSYD